MGEVSYLAAQEAVVAGLEHVKALDRAARGGPVRAFLSADDLWLKGSLVVVVLIGMAVAASGLSGVVVVLALALLAAVPASIAEGRGGRWLAWYLYGLLLFPLAVGHALFLSTPADRPGLAAGDRQLQALVGGAAALLIALIVGFIASALGSDGSGEGREACDALSREAGAATTPGEAGDLYREAAACLDGR